MMSNFNLSYQGHYASSRRQIYRQEALKKKKNQRYREKMQEALEAMEEVEVEDGSALPLIEII